MTTIFFIHKTKLFILIDIKHLQLDLKINLSTKPLKMLQRRICLKNSFETQSTQTLSTVKIPNKLSISLISMNDTLMNIKHLIWWKARRYRGEEQRKREISEGKRKSSRYLGRWGCRGGGSDCWRRTAVGRALEWTRCS